MSEVGTAVEIDIVSGSCLNNWAAPQDIQYGYRNKTCLGETLGPKVGNRKIVGIVAGEWDRSAGCSS